MTFVFHGSSQKCLESAKGGILCVRKPHLALAQPPLDDGGNVHKLNETKNFNQIMAIRWRWPRSCQANSGE